MDRFTRRAEWVWTRGPRSVQRMFAQGDEQSCEEDRNRFIYFRRTVRLSGPAVSAIVSISAGGRYQLFVNGSLVGRGPDRCHPEFQHVDSYEITAGLHEGENVVAALVHTYGRDMSWYVRPPALERETFGCGGFFLQGDVLLEGDKRPIVLDTGGDGWRFLVSTAWDPETGGDGPGFAERFSFQEEPIGWREADFDDLGWAVPIVQRATLRLGDTAYRPFPRLVVPQAAKLLDGEPVRPASILLGFSRAASEDVEGFRKEGAAVPAQGWIQLPSRPPRVPAQPPKGDEDAAIKRPLSVYLLDFGRTQMGHLFFELEGRAGQQVRYSYSERLAANGAALLPAEVQGISTPPIHSIRLREGRQRFDQFEAAGARYVELHVAGRKGDFTLLDAGITPTFYPADDRGRFDCSDEELAEVWEGSARTVRLCRQDGFIDCPYREQRQWTGDAYVQALFGYLMHNDPRPAERMLRQIAETQRGDGMVMMATVSDLSAAGKLFIPDFCLWWLLAFKAHYLYTGRTEVLRELLPAAIRALSWFEGFIDADSLLSDLPGWNFIDWSVELDRNGELTVLNSLYVAAVRSITSVAEAIGSAHLTDGLAAIAERVTQSINRLLFDDTRGLYADARNNGTLSNRFSQHANAAAIAFGIAPQSRHKGIVEVISDPQTLVLGRAWDRDVDRPFDPGRHVVMAQPFFSHIVHAAYAMTGKIENILEAIRKQWLPMVRKNGTVWEHWQDTPVTSLCHAFSSTPLYDLPTYVVGIRPTKPGFTELTVSPMLGDLQWASATVPTPRGEVTARWERRRENELDLSLFVPSGSLAVVEPPKGFRGPTEALPGKHQFTYRASD